MQRNLLFLISTWISFRTACAIDIETDVCDNLPGLEDCKGTLSVPYGSTVKACTQNGRTQVCGVHVLKKNVNVCDAVRAVLPGDPGYNFIENAREMCWCLPKAIIMAKSSDFAPTYYDGQLSRTSLNLMGLIEHVDSCIINEKDFQIYDNRAEVIETSLLTAKEWTVVRGADINFGMYKKLLWALKDCFVKNSCDTTAMRNWFTDYYHISYDIKTGALYRMLNDWLKLYATLKTRIADVATASKSLQSCRNTASSGVSAIQKSICKGNACTGATVKAFLAKVSQTLESVKNRQAISADIDPSNKAIAKMERKTNELVGDMKLVPSADYLANLYYNGALTTMEGVIRAFPVTENMYAGSVYLKVEVSPIVRLTKYQTLVKTSQSLLSEVLAPDWKKRTDLFKTASAIKVRDGLIQIQAIMKKELQDPLSKLAKALQSLDTTLERFPLRKQTIQTEQCAVSYRRWNLVALPVPCSKRVPQTFKQGSFSETVTYTKVERCDYGPEWYYLPSQYIPYFKWRFSS